VTSLELDLEYDDQTVELGPWPMGSSQIKQIACRLLDLPLERKNLEKNFALRVYFKVEIVGNKPLGAGLDTNELRGVPKGRRKNGHPG
jgi:hypothetical protein